MTSSIARRRLLAGAAAAPFPSACGAGASGDPGLLRRVRGDMYRSLGHYPTETSEHSSEYVPWYLRHDSEIERLRLPVGGYLEIIEENTASYEQTRDALAKDAPLPVEGTLEYAP